MLSYFNCPTNPFWVTPFYMAYKPWVWGIWAQGSTILSHFCKRHRYGFGLFLLNVSKKPNFQLFSSTSQVSQTLGQIFIDLSNNHTWMSKDIKCVFQDDILEELTGRSSVSASCPKSLICHYPMQTCVWTYHLAKEWKLLPLYKFIEGMNVSRDHLAMLQAPELGSRGPSLFSDITEGVRYILVIIDFNLSPFIST